MELIPITAFIVIEVKESRELIYKLIKSEKTTTRKRSNHVTVSVVVTLKVTSKTIV